jgi:DnaK suppressor protein
LTAQLVARRDALRKVLAEEVDRLREPSEAFGVGDTVDAAIDSANDEICSLLAELESRELVGIEQTLERIADGRYGRCETCGDRIPAGRLAALPCTTRCIRCQRADETRSRSRADVAEAHGWERIADDPDSDVGEIVASGGRTARGYEPEELAGLSMLRDTRTA